MERRPRSRLAQSVAASFLVSGGLLASASPAHAQVNVESLRADLQKKAALASIEGSFAGRAGNVQNVVFGGGASAATRYDHHGFFGSSRADYATTSGATTVSDSFIHLRYHYELLGWLFPEAFAQQQQDKFQRLQFRELFGVGPRFILLDEDEGRIAFGTGYMFEYERISVPQGAPDPAVSTAQRSSNYLTATWQPDSRVRLLGTVYMQPRFDAPRDFRTLFEAALTTEIVKRLSVKVLFSLRYDSRPPTDVKTTDVELKNAFVLQF